MNYNFTDEMLKVLASAREEALHFSQDYVGTEHILLAAVRGSKRVLELLSMCGVQGTKCARGSRNWFGAARRSGWC